MPHGFIAILCADAAHFHRRQLDASTMIFAEVQACELAASKRQRLRTPYWDSRRRTAQLGMRPAFGGMDEIGNH